MSKVLRASIYIATAGAVYGLGKVASAALSSASAVDKARLAARQYGPELGRVAKAAAAVRSVARGSYNAAAHNLRDALRAPREKISPLVLHPIEQPGKIHMPDHTVLEQFQRHQSNAGIIKNAIPGMKDSAAFRVSRELERENAAKQRLATRVQIHEQNLAFRTAQAKQSAALAVSRTQMRAAALENAAANRAQKNVALALRGMGELRGWYRTLFGAAKSTTAKMAASGANSLGIVSGVKTAKQSLSSLRGAMQGVSQYWLPIVASLGAGAGLLSGAGSMGQRAADLSVSRESAVVTFDTLLGDQQKSKDMIEKLTRFAVATPFQMEDVTAAARRMLRVETDVNKNMDLVKLAANISALTPGSSVEDVGRGITQAATSGEFEILKGTYGIPLFARQFDKKAGEKGFKEDVIKMITQKFEEMTGGRDLVKALSTTTFGLMSTIRDSIDNTLRTIGDRFIQTPLMKGGMQGVIAWLDSLTKGVEQVFDGEELTQSPFVNSLSRMIGRTVKLLEWSIDKIVFYGTKAADWFDALPVEWQDGLVVGLFGAAGLGILSAIAVPLVAIMGALWPAIAAVGSALFAFGSSAALPLLGLALPTLGTLFVGLTASLYDFSDTIGGNLRRAYETIGPYVRDFVMMMVEGLPKAWATFTKQASPAVYRLYKAFVRLRDALAPILETFLIFINRGERSQEVFEGLGRAFGVAFGILLDTGTFAIDIISWGVKELGEQVRDLTFDIYAATAAFSDMFNPKKKEEFWESAEKFGLALYDVVTMPLRNAAIIMLDLYRGVAGIIAQVTGLDSTELFAEIDKTRANISEGLSKRWESPDHAAMDTGTDKNVFPPEVCSTVEVTTPIKIDGEKVAKGQAKVQMRSRASGRGGSPMTPDEVGYVINNGRIRAVGYEFATSPTK